MNQYLDAAIKAARAAGALVRGTSAGRSKSMSKKLTISSWSLMFAPKRSSRTTKVPAHQSISSRQSSTISAPRSSKSHKPKNGEVRKGTAVRFDLSEGRRYHPTVIKDD